MRRLSFVLLVVLAAGLLTSCGDDSTGPAQIPDFEGLYAYTGSVNGAPELSLAGTLSITNQSGSSASIVQNITLRASGVPVIVLTTLSPSTATLTSGGAISWEFMGSGDFGDGLTRTWTHQQAGNLSGNLIQGNWTLTVSGLGTDAGAFSAQR